ncbi:MAG: hypothetical protein VB957_08110 [Pseudomonadales bacterium]
MNHSPAEELQLSVDSDGGSIPCTFYKPKMPNGIVLLGHGLSVDRFHQTVVGPAKMLADDFNLAVLVPELPFHGKRAKGVYQWNEYTSI